MVVQGTTGEVVGTAGVTVAGTPVASTPLETAEGTMDGATVGMRVIVDGMAVTMPGFWGTQVAQIPVK
jgi:hypothetical protein